MFRIESLTFKPTKKEPLQTTLQLEVPTLLNPEGCHARPLNINKRPLRHYGSPSIWLRLLRDTLVDSRGLGWQGRAGQLWNLYGAGISLFKGREILEGSNIFIENSISPLRVNWCVPSKTWVFQVLSKWT